MKIRLQSIVLATLMIFAGGATMQAQPAPPLPGPQFTAPGYESQIANIKGIFDLHYPGSGPKATMWEEWLSLCSMWPDTAQLNDVRAAWRHTLLTRIMEEDGYVATHQHPSIAHQHGWPFPFYRQAGGTWGWHFQLPPIGPEWHASPVSTEEGWTWKGLQSQGIEASKQIQSADKPAENRGGIWNLALESTDASITTPEMDLDTDCAPFIQLRWRAKGLGNAQPCIEWVNDLEEAFTPAKRFHFEAVESDEIVYTMIPIFQHPEWKGRARRLRISFGSQNPSATVGIDSIFAQFDTRHDINNSSFILGSDNYFRWTGDVTFLRQNIERMRKALWHILKTYHVEDQHVVVCEYPGHDGRPGYTRKEDGTKEFHFGHGIGSDYWDILPIGNMDAYATNQVHKTLLKMADIEQAILQHPEWNMPVSPYALDSGHLRELAGKVREKYQSLFWNPKTGRFVACIDTEGKGHDYGFTFLNLESIYYGMPNDEQVKSILDWIDGKRIVEGDTSTGADIYHWRFAPRATTLRNLDWYFWAWNAPESIPFGYQIQDGGAVLGFSFFDIMARLAYRGADDAWARLMAIGDWFGEIQAAGGYRAYYSKPERGTMQGSGTAGGLGLDMEFFESAMLPQTLLYGFLGFEPLMDGFAIRPNLPSSLPSLEIKGIDWQGLKLDISASKDAFTVHYKGGRMDPLRIQTGDGNWTLTHTGLDGAAVAMDKTVAKEGAWLIPLLKEGSIVFKR